MGGPRGRAWIGIDCQIFGVFTFTATRPPWSSMVVPSPSVLATPALFRLAPLWSTATSAPLSHCYCHFRVRTPGEATEVQAVQDVSDRFQSLNDRMTRAALSRTASSPRIRATVRDLLWQTRKKLILRWMNYLNLRPSQFRSAIQACPVAYLPLGTLEWHGEHLPIGADALQSHGFFLRAAAEIGGIVVPPLFLGPDLREPDTDLIGMDTCPLEEAVYPRQQFAGSAYWISDEGFVIVLEACLSQLARAGFKMVAAHGHGPSTNTFLAHSEEWQERYGLKLFTMRNALTEAGLGFMVDHAAANETSIVLALQPELVDLDAIRDQDPLLGIAGPDPRINASAELGEKIIAAQIEWLRKLVGDQLPKVP